MMFKPFALITSLLAMTAVAAPNELGLQKRAETELLAQNIEYAIKAADCSLLGCATVAASSVCIAAAILKKDPVNLISCVAGDVGALCSCAGCVPQLGDFLEEKQLC
ncbi:hypothetical protein SLS57_011192 [Botryosphaeria dothidea]